MSHRLTPIALVVCAVAVCLAGTPAFACSTFCLRGDVGPVFGKNYDWHISDGLLMVNKRDTRKVATADSDPAQWTSKYGSVTFNQYGREWPSGGMNEAGLVIELMWLDETEYPGKDARAAIGNLPWIQYQLDNCATLDEVLATDADVRISRGGSARVHYLVAEASGAAASVEFIDGKLVHHRGADMPAQVLTNSTYEQSAAYLAEHEGFGGKNPRPQSKSSLDRFVCAADLVARYDGGDAVPYAFDILTTVAQGEYTQWSIVYDIRARRIHFRTRDARNVRHVDMTALDFACDSPVRILDVDQDASGDVTADFTDYTFEANEDLIKRACRGTPFLTQSTAKQIRQWAGYGGRFGCAD